MTALWISICLISLVVAAVIVRCLGRAGRTVPPARAAFDLIVYKDQLAEVERDYQRGVLDTEQATAARTEIERRILARADAADRAAMSPKWNQDEWNQGGRDQGGRDQGGWASPLAIGLALVVPSAALAIYAALGAPQLPNVPYATRNIPGETRLAAETRQIQEMEILVARLAEKLQAEPGNIQSWMLLGRSYVTMGRTEDAIIAMKKAFDLAPDDPGVLVRYAEVLISGTNNAITRPARALFDKALSIDPRNASARYYLALAKAQANDVGGAVQDWVDLIAISPANAPWLTTVRAQIAAASKELGVDPDRFKPSAAARAMGQNMEPAMEPTRAAPGIPGPSREDVEAAGRMSVEDRQEMIRGMVQRLADRLAANPDDAAGWRRLAGAYRVLGEAAKAKDADARAKAAEK